jgi:hypothetical protein
MKIDNPCAQACNERFTFYFWTDNRTLIQAYEQLSRKINQKFPLKSHLGGSSDVSPLSSGFVQIPRTPGSYETGTGIYHMWSRSILKTPKVDEGNQ